MKAKVRDWHVRLALESMASLHRTLLELTEDEVIAALTLESQSLRRKSIMDRLTQRAIRLNEMKYSAHLQRKFHGT